MSTNQEQACDISCSRGLSRFVKNGGLELARVYYSCFRKLARFTERTLRFFEKVPPETITSRNIDRHYGRQCEHNWLTNVEAGASESDFIARMGEPNHFLLLLLG